MNRANSELDANEEGWMSTDSVIVWVFLCGTGADSCTFRSRQRKEEMAVATKRAVVMLNSCAAQTALDAWGRTRPLNASL